MSRYAERTTVPSDRSRAEIESTLRRYGASAFMSGWNSDGATIGFDLAGRRVLLRLPLPDRDAAQFRLTTTRRTRSASAHGEVYEQAVRQRWRALLLVIKAKLEAVEAGITTLEAEFLDGIALPSGATVGDWLRPQLAEVYDRGDMPALLPGSGS